jgi:hypothetical protein
MNYIHATEWELLQPDIDLFFDSPLPNEQFNCLPDSLEEEDLSGLHLPQPSTSPLKGRKGKVEKVGRIRTNRNSQKIYHNILKHWLLQNHMDDLANKYNKYFNQRIYFILILQEIVKTIDGAVFVRSYQQLAADVRKKKDG